MLTKASIDLPFLLVFNNLNKFKEKIATLAFPIAYRHTTNNADEVLAYITKRIKNTLQANRSYFSVLNEEGELDPIEIFARIYRAVNEVDELIGPSVITHRSEDGQI
jgi:hypothetical protein